MRGRIKLFKQNLVNGLPNEARKGKRWASNKYDVRFQVIKRAPKEAPKKKKLRKLTSPKYSGVKNKYLIPKT